MSEGFISATRYSYDARSRTKTITLIGSGTCGADTCSFTVTCLQPAAGGFSARQFADNLQPAEICLPFSATDANNTSSRSRPHLSGERHYGLLYAAAFWSVQLHGLPYRFLRRTASRTIKLTVDGRGARGNSVPRWRAVASIAKRFMRVDPADFHRPCAVTVLPAGSYNPGTGRVSVWITQSGTFPSPVIAAGSMWRRHVHFNLRVTWEQGPQISWSGDTRHDHVPDCARQLCLPVTVNGTGVQVVVTPGGYYAAGLPACRKSAGSFYVKITGTGTCGVAKCSTLVTLRANQAPLLSLADSRAD